MIYFSVKLRYGIVSGINDNFGNVQWQYIHLKHNEKIERDLSKI